MDQFPAQGQDDQLKVGTSTRLWPAVVGGGVLALVLGAAIGLLLVRWSNGSAEPPPDSGSARTVRLEPVTYRSDSPFTESVVSMTDDELRAASSALVGDGDSERPSGRVSGDTSRLYGSRRSAPPCDVARLAELLNADDATLAAWAGVVGVEPTEVPALVHSFTPVLLAADTAVTNHTYGSNGAESLQSVLEAGTPVLIDDRGAPRVQCSCGNPLLAPDRVDDPSFVGERWETFDDAQTVEVVAADKPTPVLVTVDTDTSEEVETSLGGTVSLDGVLVTTDSGVMVVDDSGTPTTVIDRPVEAVFDDGVGGLVYTLARSDLGADEYADHPPADPAEGAIWHLAAGATEAVSLTDLSDTQTWHELLAVGQLGSGTYVAYTPLHVERYPGEYPESVAEGPAVVREQSSGEVTTLIENAVGWEGGVSAASIGGDRLAIAVSAEAYLGWTVFDSSLEEVPNACEAAELDDAKCPVSAVLNDHGQLVTTDSVLRSPDASRSDAAIAFDPSSFAELERWPLGFSPVDNLVSMSQARGGFITLTFEYSFEDGSGIEGALVDLATGELHDFPSVLDGQISSVWVLEAPLLRPLTHSDHQSEDSVEESAPPGSPITSDSEVDVHGIGAAHVGMRFEEVEVAIGAPLFVSDDLETGGECVSVAFSTGSGHEGLGGLGGDGVLGRVDVHDGPWETTEGIGIGATEEQVRAAYPRGLTEDVHPYVETGKYLRYRPEDDPGSMMIFELDEGRVTSFRAGQPDWVELIEGCA